MNEYKATHRGVVYPWQCDHMGHMNVMWYVGKFDEASWQLFTLLGFTPTYLREQHRLMAAVDQCIAYRRELRAGDVIEVRSSVVEMRNSSVMFVHRMQHAEHGWTAAVTRLTAVHLDAETRRSCRIPDDIRRASEALRLPDPAPWLTWPPRTSE